MPGGKGKMSIMAEVEIADVVIEQPASYSIKERITLFSGFVYSNYPVHELNINLNGVEQRWINWCHVSIPTMPAERRNRTSWRFRCEVASLMSTDQRSIAMEIFFQGHLICRHFFRCDFKFDRIALGRPLIYFLHIPKTAGTSLRGALEALAPDVRLLSIYPDPAFISHEQLNTLSSEAFNDVDFIFGHYSYGMHRISSRQYKYISVIRRPAEIIKSYYLFTKYVQRTAEFSGYASIDEAISQSASPIFDNCLVRYFSGNFSSTNIDEADLLSAIENIKQDFAYIGLSEDMHCAINYISAYLGLPISHLYVNQTPETAEASEIDLDRLGLQYVGRIQYDIRLYVFVKEYFEKASTLYREPVVRLRSEGSALVGPLKEPRLNKSLLSWRERISKWQRRP